jgi:hypothetical protein
MLSMYFPSVWRNKKNNSTWKLSLERTCGGPNRPGVTAVCREDPQKKGKIYWAEAQGAFDLIYIIATPRRTSLGSILTFAFADAAVSAQSNRVKIASANPAEHGFYRHMGFYYDPAMLLHLTNATPQGQQAQLWSTVTVQNDDGQNVDILRAHMACELIGDAGFVRTKSETSAEKTWEPAVG